MSRFIGEVESAGQGHIPYLFDTETGIAHRILPLGERTGFYSLTAAQSLANAHEATANRQGNLDNFRLERI